MRFEGGMFTFSYGAMVRYLGNGSFMQAKAYPMTAMAAAFSRSSVGTILSSVSAALW